MIQTGDALPGFEVRTAAGSTVSSADVWQRLHVLLIALPADAAAVEAYRRSFDALDHEWSYLETALVVTTDPVDGVPPGTAVAADRWGEVLHVAPFDPARPDTWPSPQTCLTWMQGVAYRCPECEGEAR